MCVVQSVGQDLRPEAVAVPDVEVGLHAQHVDVRRRACGFTERRRNDHTPLGVELGQLAPVGSGHFEGFAAVPERGEGPELCLDGFPHREWVQTDEFPSGRQAGQIQRRPVFRFDVRSEGAGHFEAPLVVNPG